MPRWVCLPLNTPAFPGRTSVRRVFPSTASRPVGQTRPSRATQPSRRAVCLRPSCSPLPSSDPRSVPGDVVRWNTSVRAASAALPQGPSLRSGFFCPGPSTLNRPHPPHSQAHPDFTAMRLIPDAFAVHTTPRRPPSGSTLSLPALLDMPSSTTPGRSQPVCSSLAVPDIGLRHVMSGSALPTILQSASRRADFSGLPGSLLLRPVKLLAPCADLTRVLPATGTFTSRLPTSRSPFSPLGITTTVTGPFCRRDSHPLE